MKKRTTDEFIRLAREKHGDIYDYSQSEYIGARGKITIICPEHGPWQPQASSHLVGTGCPDCGGRKQLTLDKFINRARKIHGDKFDYSKATYKNSETSLTITCPEHGEFQQQPNTHLNGTGCPDCGKVQRGLSKRGTTEDFIRRAKKVHGDRYEYSKAEYVRGHDKAKIICRKHGEFEQTPMNHLTGFGCKLCGFENAGQYHKKDTEKFIVASREIHGDTYDYSQTKYASARDPLTIICPKHGQFEQIAGVHLRGAGCERCSYEVRGEAQRLPYADFVKRASAIHENFYKYLQAKNKYRDTATKITITCPEHGEFLQLAGAHLQGRGCPVCRYIKSASRIRKTQSDFVREAMAIHGDIYDYSQAEYKGSHEYITIICPIDGPFSQSPTSHLSGTGCPRCSRRGQGAPRNLVRALRGEFDEPKDAFVYIVRFNFPNTNQRLYKIGSGSGTRWRSTAASIRRVGGTELETTKVDFKTSGEAIVVEHIAHDQVMETKYVVPPEFKFPGYSEVFTKEPDLAVVEAHPTLMRFQSGDRWDPRDAV